LLEVLYFVGMALRTLRRCDVRGSRHLMHIAVAGLASLLT
jgi:hypothetical protein